MILGKRVIEVQPALLGDDGIVITFDDGTILEVAFCAGEGLIALNGNTLDSVDVEEMCGEVR